MLWQGPFRIPLLGAVRDPLGKQLPLENGGKQYLQRQTKGTAGFRNKKTGMLGGAPRSCSLIGGFRGYFLTLPHMVSKR